MSEWPTVQPPGHQTADLRDLETKLRATHLYHVNNFIDISCMEINEY